jgi:hypothetical protein
MNAPFENMTQAENDFFERMKTAPESERDVFRKALQVLMTCFGENAPGGILVLHLMKGEDDLTMHGFNLQPHLPPAMLAAAMNALGYSMPPDVDNMTVQ